MLTVFDKYVMKIQAMAVLVTALSLTLIILLTQSIRYLELVISSDASPFYFLIMIALAIPKFLEAILPLAFAIATIYTVNRLMNDREMIIMNAAGASVTTQGRPFITFATIMMVVQFILSGWISPLAVEKLQLTRSEVKGHYATLMFREGVFNQLGNGLTAYVEERNGLNEILNLLIHDDKGALNKERETTIIAKRGIVNITEDSQQLLVYNGTQYIKDLKTGTISQLNFNQYSLDVPIQESVISNKWKEPDERVFQALFINDTASDLDQRKKYEFIAEIHKRLSSPLLLCAFVFSIIFFLFMGSWNRRTMSISILKAGAAVIIIQAGYIVLYNEAKDAALLNIGLYAVTLLPTLYVLWRIYKYQKI